VCVSFDIWKESYDIGLHSISRVTQECADSADMHIYTYVSIQLCTSLLIYEKKPITKVYTPPPILHVSRGAGVRRLCRYAHMYVCLYSAVYVSFDIWKVTIFIGLYSMSYTLMCASKETYNNEKRHIRETSGGAGVCRCVHILPGEMECRPLSYVSFDVCIKRGVQWWKRHFEETSGGAGVCRSAHMLPGEM